MPFKTLLQKTGLVAILRGVKPDEIVAIGEKLYAAGFRLIEIPMNSPEALQSISLLRDALPKDCLVGAGTVLSVEQVVAVKEAGGQIIVMPHCDTAVIRRARALGMYCAPGVATPTEAFAAIEHGANAIKLFPAEQITPEVTKAWRAVIPQSVPMLPVGGITPETMARYLSHGANGFGLGSALYHPSMTPEQVYENAVLFMNAWNNLNSN